MSGRPSICTDELIEAVCAEIAAGKSLRTVCAGEDMPAKTTIFRWLHTNPTFRNQYEIATAARSDALVEEMLEFADDPDADVNRSRLQVDVRKWIASKLKPKKYGDKLALGGSDEMPPLKVTAVDVRG